MRTLMAGENAIRAGRPVLRSRAQADELVLCVLREHAESLLRVARRHSLCSDDAQDAYQRAAEIFLRHARTLEAADAHKWVHTVVKHEAMRLRAQRTRSVGAEDVDLDGRESGSSPTPDEQVASFDLLTRSAEALQRLKPQELRALWLKAQGHSYQEIAELCDWSYTKVNRCITEGRRSFLDRYERIASGEECRRWAPVLSAMADGEASARDLAAVRPHLRHCPACRALLRDLGESSRRVAALLPAPVAAAAADHAGLLARIHDAIFGQLHERLALSATRLQGGAEAALPGKLAVVAASAAAIGGGVAVERAATTRVHRPVARHAPASVRSVRAAAVVTVREPAPPAPPRSPARAAHRTATSEFGLRGDRAAAASNGTAAREFAQPETSGGATVASAPAPAPAPSSAGRDAGTAAAEFGG
jgi:RNA polymerase sigma factor (sigma-70 family)